MDASGLAARAALHFGLDPIHLVEDPACLIEQQRTALGEFHAARQAMKEGRAQLPLKLADLQAEGRRLDSEPSGCAGEMQFLGNRYEIAEMPELHGPTTGVDRLGTLRRHREKPALGIPHFNTVSFGLSGVATTPALTH